MDLSSARAVVTGAGGFIGSHLVEELIGRGCNVTAVVHYNSGNRWGWLDALSSEALSGVRVVAADIVDAHQVKSIIVGADVVFHLAALIAIPYSYEAPESYVRTNILGTLNVLQACRDVGQPRLLVTSTSEVYGTAKYVPIDEKHPLQAQSPYAATKIAADRLSESFSRSFDLPVTIVRPFNAYGPRQSARAVIPSIIGQLLAGVDEVRLGSLTPTRDFTFVRDTVRGFAAIAECDAAVGQEINIASQYEVSIGDVARRIITLINPQARLVSESERVRPARSEVERLLGSREKIAALTGWAPTYDIGSGLEETIHWFRETGLQSKSKAGLYVR